MTRARECGDKQRHDSQQAAESQLWSLVRSGVRRARLSVYRCEHCGGWHVGHKVKRRFNR